MLIELTVAEAMDVARATGNLPPFILSVTGEGEDVHIQVDLRKVPDAPSAVKLAARLVPIVRGTLRVVSFMAGTAVLGVTIHAGGLPAHKLLGFIDAPLSAALRSKGLPPDAVKVLGGDEVAVDCQALLSTALASTLPGVQITSLTYSNATLRAQAVL